MTTPLPLGLAPYISPLTLMSAPTGVDFTTIPAQGGSADGTATPAENMAEMWNMVARATARVDNYCNQVLRATTDVEVARGPDYYTTTGPGAGGAAWTPYWGNTWAQNARIILQRWPILQVTGVKTCPNNLWPRTWTALPAGYFEPENPVIGLYGSSSPDASAQGGQAVIVGGGYINWCYGRNGWVIEVTYLNGYPHCSLTAAATAGATSLSVNDCTGWGIANYAGTFTGATGVIKDSGWQESVHVASTSVASGPGTLTLASAITYNHAAGTIVTTLPSSIEQACIYFAAAEALTRGATSTTIHSVGGAAQSSSGGARELAEEAELLCHPFRRTL